ncbi:MULTISPECIES: CvpA family protein [Salinicola]|jgi:membrane protein required for colicin V production|uniref:CvpA family protein n=1 Tax=Salinicola TaxID=404432 RepID=UPI000B3FBC94|nr:CvpA family protein [Salinicola salarius]MED5501083.1 CvpA family protein [Pseudomonadota bacterium]
MTLTWLDYAFLLVLTISMLAGFMRGLVREALGLGAWIVALLAARIFAKPIADLLEPYISHPDARLVLGFVLIIFVVVMICGFIIRLLNAAIEWVGMGFFNRVAGAIFGLARGGAILVIVTVVIGLTPLAQLQAWQQAQLRPSFESLRTWAVVQLQSWDVDPSAAEEAMRHLPMTLPGRDDASSSSSYSQDGQGVTIPAPVPAEKPAP